MNIQHTFLDYVSLIVSSVAILFIALTMLLRGNDYRRKAKPGYVAFIRIIGFILTGFSPWGVIGWWLLTGMWPSLFMMSFLMGTSFVFFTTENLPPWWVFLTKGSDEEPPHNRRATDAQ